MQRHPTAQGKYFGNYKSDKGLLSRMYKSLKMINSPIPNDLINKSANGIEFVFHHGELLLKVQKAKKMKKKK